MFLVVKLQYVKLLFLLRMCINFFIHNKVKFGDTRVNITLQL
jgi:hypothetical protein